MLVWEFYEEKKQRIEEKFPDICNICEQTLENIWLIYIKLKEELNRNGEEYGELPPVEQMNLLLSIRNIPYLISAFILAEKGLVSPSRNILRTVYEQILRIYLFLEFPDDASLWYNYWNNPDEFENDMKRKMWMKHKYMIDKLYKDSKKESVKEFYKNISRYAHPNIRSIWSDYANIKEVEDTLNGLLGSVFETVKLLQKTFGPKLSPELMNACEDIKRQIGEYLVEIFDLEPNK